jgi:hypothetical protein
LATQTLVTAAPLVAVAFSRSPATLLPADLATVAARIRDDFNVARPVLPGSFVREGMVVIPNRGRIRLHTGDVVATDANGCVVIVTAASIAAGGAWTLT